MFTVHAKVADDQGRPKINYVTLRVEALDNTGKVIPDFSADKCLPIKGDSARQQVRWKGVADLGVLAGKPVRFRFHLTSGRLYSFWVSPDESGASYGYVAAGGPEFSSNRDTAGSTGVKN